MSYTPINWQTGDTITAEKMNRMDNGWSVESSGGELFSETVTTVDDEGTYTGTLTFSEEIPDGTLTVTFDGDEYTCVCEHGEFGSLSGSYEDYPFYVFYVSSLGKNIIQTATAGTHTISVATGGVAVEVSNEFSTAVNSCITMQTSPFLCVAEQTTFEEMYDAQSEGRLLYFYARRIMHIITSFTETESNTAVQALPAGVQDVETYGFYDDGEGNLIFQIFAY